MLQWIKPLSESPVVNGSEHRAISLLEKHFRSLGLFVKKDALGSITVSRGNGPFHTLILTPIDVPGYLCLYREKERSYLAPSSKETKNVKDCKFVCDQDGSPYEIKRDKDDESLLWIEGSEAELGDAFSLQGSITLKKTFVSGRFSSRFALVSMLIAFTEKNLDPELAVCFTVGYYSLNKAEANLIRRESPKKAILIGFMNDEGSNPIVLRKDGKTFSSPALSIEVTTLCKKNGIQLCQRVSELPITAQERAVTPSCTDLLSLVLPCRKALTDEERVSIRSLALMEKLLHLI